MSVPKPVPLATPGGLRVQPIRSQAKSTAVHSSIQEKTPGRTLPAALPFPLEPLSPEPPSASEQGYADPAQGCRVAATHRKQEGELTPLSGCPWL